jgi:hypothetical protein
LIKGADAMDTSTINIIESGLARCVTEARGSHGLEGYGLDQSYRFERCEDKKGRYCRVYPDVSFPDYYETCGEGVFVGYFEPVVVGGRSNELTTKEKEAVTQMTEGQQSPGE